MLKTSKLLTITVPKATYAVIRKTAKDRQETVSGMLRNAFDQYISNDTELYSDQQLKQLLKKDQLPLRLRKDLDQLLK